LRIAVLGDSFIWGSGVPDSVIWTHKLEQQFNKHGLPCEIFNWGKSGWSTMDEFSFLRNSGIQFRFDLLIFAFVVNDPVIDTPPMQELITRDGAFERSILNPLSMIFPNDISFIKDLMNDVSATYFDYGYMNWLKKIYTDENLIKYASCIREIKQYCTQDQMLFYPHTGES
jgi:hypothetical protein